MLTSLRHYLRSKLLAWLGYGFRESPPQWRPGYGASGTAGALLFDLEESAKRSVSAGIMVQLGVRRVPEVPPGVVRIVVEVCE
jgi:hypothetical protein